MQKTILSVLAILIAMCSGLIAYSFAYPGKETPVNNKPYVSPIIDNEEPKEVGSDFISVDTDGFLKLIASPEIKVIVFGRPDCGKCRTYFETLNEFKTKFNRQVYYVDVTKVDSNAANYMTMVNFVNSRIQEYSEKNGVVYTTIYSITPLTVLVKDNALLDLLTIEQTYSDLEVWMNTNGVMPLPTIENNFLGENVPPVEETPTPEVTPEVVPEPTPEIQ